MISPVSVSSLAAIVSLQGLTVQPGGKNTFPWPKGSILDAQVKLPAEAHDFIILQIGQEEVRVKRPAMPLNGGRVLFEVIENKGVIELRIIPNEQFERYIQNMISRVLGDRQVRYEGMARHLETQLASLDDSLNVQIYRDMSQSVPYYGLVDALGGYSRGSLAIERQEPLSIRFRMSFEHMHTLFVSFTKQSAQWHVELFDPSGDFVNILNRVLGEWAYSRQVLFRVNGFLPPWAKMQERTA